MSALH